MIKRRAYTNEQTTRMIGGLEGGHKDLICLKKLSCFFELIFDKIYGIALNIYIYYIEIIYVNK